MSRSTVETPRVIQIDTEAPGPRELHCSMGPDQKITIPFEATAGLHQLSVIADARDFDFDKLYYELPYERNKGRRTGPWDFDLTDGNKPLVPTYRVTLDGRLLGLWFFQRISLQDLAARRFRGRMAIRLQTGGAHTLTLEPFRSMGIHWQSAWLEPDPEDRLEPLPPSLKPAPGNVPVAAWADETFWQAQRQKLSTTHRMFREPLMRVFDHAMDEENRGGEILPALVAAHGLDGRAGAIVKALAIVDAMVAQPSWGNPDPDGYGHNGDMGAAAAFLSIARAYHMLGDHLGEQRRRRMLDKLRYQGDIFVDQALLTRDYWGGSLLQDHGWNAIFDFTVAALHLYGIIDEAEHWLNYALPRTRRALDAINTDGIIPNSSYSSPWLYLERLGWLRQTQVAMMGEEHDLLDRPSICALVDGVSTLYHEPTGQLLNATAGDTVLLIGGAQVFSALASKYRDGRAAWLQQQYLRVDPVNFYHVAMRNGYYRSSLWDFFTYDPTVEPVPPRTGTYLRHFSDAGLAHWRNERSGAALTVDAGPWCGQTSDRRASSPSDRMAMHVGAGHFRFYLDGHPILGTPDCGYALRTLLRQAMLIDDQGQVGSIGYPMSIPAWRHRGERIESSHWDEQTQQGVVRLDLAPAYPDDLGVVSYTREFLVGSQRRVICRDRVVLDRPRTLSWLFHGRRDAGVRLESPLGARFGTQPLRIDPVSAGLDLHASVQRTDIVYGYASTTHFAEFDHVRYDTTTRVDSASIDFVLQW